MVELEEDYITYECKNYNEHRQPNPASTVPTGC